MTQLLANGLSFAKGTGFRVLTIAGAALLLIWILHLLTSHMVHETKSDSKADAAHQEQARTIANMLFSIGIVIVLIGAVWVIFKNPHAWEKLEEHCERLNAWREKRAPGSVETMRQMMARMMAKEPAIPSGTHQSRSA
jgi:magnesium-transporting ATPase (P-type)